MKTNTKITLAAFLTGMTLIGASSAFARDGGQGHMGGKMSQAAVAACEGKSEGASVSLQHPKWGNVNAVCAPNREGKLAAMPAKMLEHRKAAAAACVGQAEGSKVSVPSMHEAGKNVEATCKMGRDKELMALPDHKKGDKKHHRDGRKQAQPAM